MPPPVSDAWSEGWFSGWLIKRGHSLNMARKTALGLSAAVMPAIVLVTHVPVGFAILLFSIAFFGQQSWSTLIMVLPADLFPQKVVGSVAGLVGCGGAIGGSEFSGYWSAICLIMDMAMERSSASSVHCT